MRGVIARVSEDMEVPLETFANPFDFRFEKFGLQRVSASLIVNIQRVRLGYFSDRQL
jgi:hypothetical protein